MVKETGKILSEIMNILLFYKSFRNDLLTLMEKYGETEYLKMEICRINGKIEILEELKRFIEEGEDE